MRNDATATGAWTRMIVQGLERLDIDVRVLCEELRLSYAALTDSDARIPCDDLARLWQLAERWSGNRNLGMRAGERVELNANHVHAHLLLSSRNLREAILALSRTLPNLGHRIEVSMVEEPGGFRLCYEHARGDLPPGPQAVEFAAVVLRRFFGLAQGSALPLVSVEFTHSRGDSAEAERILGCPVHFSRPANAMVIARDLMLRTSPHYSAELSRQLIQVAEASLARVSQPNFAAEVGWVLRSRLPLGPCDADSVAALLHLSLRTFQRRLADEQTSFSEVLDQARRRVALELLEADLSLSEIAERCGFSGSRALIRAFRRWKGTTPSAYRALAATGSSRPAAR